LEEGKATAIGKRRNLAVDVRKGKKGLSWRKGSPSRGHKVKWENESFEGRSPPRTQKKRRDHGALGEYGGGDRKGEFASAFNLPEEGKRE